MTALVLLVNEAALNAAKHAFRPGCDGVFAVSLQPHAGGGLRLVVRDDGTGPVVGASAGPPATSPAGAQGLGMPIMRSLARQLGGELDVLDGPGMALAVTFAPD
ncbi:ATP-binding protein [Paracraurococcus lichenis]|uniref:ATP-binding protein n=1 Tax=Paracraurococcus lichenis TaxID=3064888 RepID=A0ABT9EA55_9PROT|nr:ATP-binding protein [Paracraurococcus sp. LOR1-02]MDO9713080.1 ATP-binding protein [Paracraurococcus sp. LOR1-02]